MIVLKPYQNRVLGSLRSYLQACSSGATLHADIPAGESAVFLRKAIQGLMAKYGIAEVSLLALDRHRLRDQIETRSQAHREAERKTAFTHWLGGVNAPSGKEGSYSFQTAR